MTCNVIKKESLLINYRIHCRRISILILLVSTTLFSSSLYLSPLAYSQEFSYLPNWRETGGGEERLSEPVGIAVDPSSGNIYVADTSQNRIQVFSSNGTFISKWGTYGAADGLFNNPAGIAVDQEGNVYVADTANDRIQVFSSNGTFISKWGGPGHANGTLASPKGIAVDPSSGNIYVADASENRIQVFSSNGTFISRWGRYGAADGLFNNPAGIAVDQEGNVYVADTANNRIQVFSSNGTFISKWGTYGATDLKLRYPAGIAIDQQANVYVADTANNRIIAFARSPLTDVSFSSEEGEIYGNDTRIEIETIYEGLKSPTAIAFLGPNDMLVLQTTNNSIMRIVNGQMLDEPVLDLGNTVRIRGCMCDITIMQNDNGTTYAFLYYYLGEVTEEDGTKKLVNRLYRYDVADGRLTNPKLIFEIPSRLGTPHNGGKVMVGPDNTIYLTIGEIRRYQTEAQNVKNGPSPDGSSSILRFTPNGDTVDGGLFGDTHPLDKYYGYGIRNSFGLDYDPITGNIWMTDNGPAYGDELNLVPPGFNGGWNKIMGFSSISPRPFNLTGLEFFNGTGKYYDPIFEWYETIGVTDLVFVPSDNNKLGKEYEGNLFVGDIKSGYLYRFLLNQSRTGLLLNNSLSDGVADNNLQAQELVFARIPGGITDLEIGPDGLLYIVSFGGKVLRLEPIDTNATDTEVEANMTLTDTEAATGTTTAGDTTSDGSLTGVSIVPGSSSLTDNAYRPNPLEVRVGDTVTWSNDDATPHTVTSGQNGQPDGQFDSSIMAPQQRFEHTFTQAGEYPYFCVLHPDMVGTIIVS